MNSKKKKAISGGVTLFLAATLLLGGTLAWTDFTQSRTNRFRGSVYYDATLHDDFDGENKDVYVENSGENTIYVRVRLDEYMQIGNINMLGQDVTGSVIDGDAGEDTEGDIDSSIITSRDKDDWIPHKYGDTRADKAHLDCGEADSIQFHTYYEWTISGKQIQYDPGTPGVVSSVLDGYKKDDAGNYLYDTYGAQIPAVDDTVGTATTIAASTPITMAEYKDLSQRADALTGDYLELWNGVIAGCWILDNDGWAYWSQPLEPGYATNLLLDEVKLIGKEPTDDWYYGIDVKLQAVSLDETNTTWYEETAGGCSENAKKLIETWHAEESQN